MNPFLFKSFWMAGYECADHLNTHGMRVDLLSASGHLTLLEADYRSLSTYNIKTVREGIRWSLVEKQPYQYDWSTVKSMIATAGKLGIQQIWDLCHFGFPDDLTPLHPLFPERFEALCLSFLQMYRSINPIAPLLITPINEVSFLSWLGGDVAGTSPYCRSQGWEVKYGLMRSYIRAVAAMKRLDANVVIISTEPLIHITAPENATQEQVLAATAQREEQFQSLNILCGLICPELGGKPEYLDIIGLNFYYSNQWTYDTMQPLAWAETDRDPGWKPLNELINEVYLRYHKPVIISETSHPGEDRGLWIEHIAKECKVVLANDIPLLGICIYPIIDRPDWDYPDRWHHSGLWDNPEIPGENSIQRVLYVPYSEAILNAQHELNLKEKITSLLTSEDLTDPIY